MGSYCRSCSEPSAYEMSSGRKISVSVQAETHRASTARGAGEDRGRGDTAQRRAQLQCQSGDGFTARRLDVSAPAKQSRGRQSITQRQAGQKEVEASPPPVFISGERGEYFVHRGWKPPEDDTNDLMDVLESFL